MLNLQRDVLILRLVEPMDGSTHKEKGNEQLTAVRHDLVPPWPHERVRRGQVPHQGSPSRQEVAQEEARIEKETLRKQRDGMRT